MFTLRRQPGTTRTRRSQSMVEFSISLLPLLMIASGLLDLGRMYFVYAAVTDAAGEGALFLSVNPKCFSPSISGCSDPNNVQYRMQAAGGRLVELHNSSMRIEYLVGTNDCVYYAQITPDQTMPVELALDTAKSPGGGVCDAAESYTYATGDQVTVHLTHGYVLITPVISKMVPLYNNQNALPLNVAALQTIIVK